MTNHADAGTPREDHVPVDLSQPITLDVRNPNGNVTVRAAERGDVLIGHVAAGPGAAEVEVQIEAHGNRIDVHAIPHPGGGWASITGDGDIDAVVGQIARAFRRGGPWSALKEGTTRLAAGSHAWCDIVIDIPRTITGRFAIQSASGDLRVEELTGKIALNAMSGDVRVGRTAGDLEIQTASGDLTIDGMRGQLAVRSASGDVRVVADLCSGAEIQTASGDIHLEATLTGDGPYRAQTASGDVRLMLQQPALDGQEPAASLAFQTVAGDAHVSAPFRKRDRRRWLAGAEGAGGPHIDVTTVSGDLSAGLVAADRAASPAPVPMPPAPPAQPMPIPPAESAPSANRAHGEHIVLATDAVPDARPAHPESDAWRLAVLEAVERGEIDVEEALQRLEAADVTASP